MYTRQIDIRIGANPVLLIMSGIVIYKLYKQNKRLKEEYRMGG